MTYYIYITCSNLSRYNSKDMANDKHINSIGQKLSWLVARTILWNCDTHMYIRTIYICISYFVRPHYIALCTTVTFYHSILLIRSTEWSYVSPGLIFKKSIIAKKEAQKQPSKLQTTRTTKRIANNRKMAITIISSQQSTTISSR